jgi:tetratricopeptide (TPR) repeat protein
MPNTTAPVLDALDADELLMLGLRSSAAGASGEALGYFKLAVGRQGDHAKAHWALAAEYASLSMPERAREHFARAVELDPGQAVARFQYGLLCLTQGDPTQAETVWAPLDALDPEHPLRLFKQGLLEMVADRFEPALQLIRCAMDDASVDPALRRDMAMTIANIESAMQAAAAQAPAPAQGEPLHEEAGGDVTIESHLALSAYRIGGSDDRH